jgi:hypothetical protein
LQRKAAPGSRPPAPARTPGGPATPQAPPVYRPQAPPRVLQTKSVVPHAPAAHPAPKVLRPQHGHPRPGPEASRPGVLQLKGAAQSPFRGGVIQCVYIKNFDGTINNANAAPTGYVKIGTHLNEDLYAPPGLVNPYLQTNWLQADVSMHVPADNDDDQTSLADTKSHYRDEIKGSLKKIKKEFLDDVSSDSEEEAEDTDPERHKKRLVVRRFNKAADLTAIASTFLTISDDEKRFGEELAQKRERDNKARADKKQMYAEDTREAYARIGWLFKRTSFYHNAYLRRAFNKAVSAAKIQEGGSKKYDQTQGAIRKALVAIVKQDFAKMNWTRDDFPSVEIWNIVERLKEDFSNASTKTTYEQALRSGGDTKKSTARAAFHHVAWKEADGGAYEEHALNPANLTVLNDQREVLDAKKLQKLKDDNKTPPRPGAHDRFGHQMTGFLKEQKGKMVRSAGGGQFQDLDQEGASIQVGIVAQSRTRKRKLCDPSVYDSLTAPSATPTTQTTTPNAPPNTTTPNVTNTTTQGTPFVFQMPPTLAPTPFIPTANVFQPPTLFAPTPTPVFQPPTFVFQQPTLFAPTQPPPTQPVVAQNLPTQPPAKKQKVTHTPTPAPQQQNATANNNAPVRRSNRTRTPTKRFK